MLEIDDIYFFIGVILTFATAYWGIWYSNKNKVNTQLSLVDQNWMSLINTFEDNFKILKLDSYQLPKNKNLFYYEGVIINTGNTDIDKGKIYKPIEFSFPDDVRIIELRTNHDLNEKVGLKTNINEDKISFEWDLLKSFEFFSFELIIESSKALNSNLFDKEVTKNHRITDLKSIKHIDAKSYKKEKKSISSKIRDYVFLFFFLFISSFGLYESIKSFYQPNVKIEYVAYSKDNMQPIKVEYFNKENLKISFGNNTKIIALKDFDKNVRVLSKIDINKNLYFQTTFLSFLFLVIILGLIRLTKENITEYKISKIISALET